MANFSTLFSGNRDIVRESEATEGQKLRVSGTDLDGFDLDAETVAGLTTVTGGLTVTGEATNEVTWTKAANDIGFLVKNSSFGTHDITISVTGSSASADFPPPVGTEVTFSTDFTVGGTASALTALLAGNTFTTIAAPISTGMGIGGLSTGTFIGSGSFTITGSVTASVPSILPTTVSSDLIVSGQLIGDTDLEIRGDSIDTTTGGFLQTNAGGVVSTAPVTTELGVEQYMFSKELNFVDTSGNGIGVVGDVKMNNASSNALTYPIDVTTGAGFNQSAANLFIQTENDEEARQILGVSTLVDQSSTEVNLRFRLTQSSGSVEIIAQRYYYVQGVGTLWLHGPSTTGFVGSSNTLGSGGIFNASGTFTEDAVTFESDFSSPNIVTVDGNLTILGGSISGEETSTNEPTDTTASGTLSVTSHPSGFDFSTFIANTNLSIDGAGDFSALFTANDTIRLSSTDGTVDVTFNSGLTNAMIISPIAGVDYSSAPTFTSGVAVTAVLLEEVTGSLTTVSGDLTVIGDFNQTSNLSTTSIPLWDGDSLEDSRISQTGGSIERNADLTYGNFDFGMLSYGTTTNAITLVEGFGGTGAYSASGDLTSSTILGDTAITNFFINNSLLRDYVQRLMNPGGGTTVERSTFTPFDITFIEADGNFLTVTVSSGNLANNTYIQLGGTGTQVAPGWNQFSAADHVDGLGIFGSSNNDSVAIRWVETTPFVATAESSLIVTEGLSVNGSSIAIPNLPTTDPGIAGQLYRTAAGVLMVSI